MCDEDESNVKCVCMLQDDNGKCLSPSGDDNDNSIEAQPDDSPADDKNHTFGTLSAGSQMNFTNLDIPHRIMYGNFTCKHQQSKRLY